MTTLPCPTTLTTPRGQTAVSGRQKTGGQPDATYTERGVPIMQFEWDDDAPLHLVTVIHAGERRHTYVIGSPARLVNFAGGLGLHVSANVVQAIDHQLAPIEVEGECQT